MTATTASIPGKSGFRKRVNTVLHHSILGAFVVAVFAPLVWVLLLSVKSLPDAYTGRLWPNQFDFSHYQYVFTNIETLPTNLRNSIWVTAGTVALTVLISVLGGYALVHLELPGKKLLLAGLIATLYFPTRVVSLISIFEIQRSLDLINTVSGLILPYVTLNLAISLLIMRSIFMQIPKELMEATKVDGCGPWRSLGVILPLVTNGIVVIIIINFVTAWGEYLLAATLTNDLIVRTMPVVLVLVAGGRGMWAWPRIAAVYIIVVVPGIIAFAIAQKLFFKGLVDGALKA
ncbi:MAG TPA: carbohydrate ABC transporter permease [Egibacteraceae bacterium]|nr:carbohydrate ABC transporter permease [Egibacteraceae bacterium]